MCAKLLIAVLVLAAGPASAAMLCVKKSGVIVLRQACKKKEKPLDLMPFGAVGPKGDPGMQGPPGVGPLTTCPPDSVLVGTTCVDTYEASVWQIPPSNAALVAKVEAGTVTLADLTGGGATELSPSSTCAPTFPVSFPANGQWTPVSGTNPPTPGIYAVSLAGVHPTACVTWFQAEQACRLSGKRLLTNQEWQAAVAGTPDPGPDNGTTDCNTVTAGDAVNTGARSSCRSSWGAFDMVGNLDEYAADWVPRSTFPCPGWAAFSDDFQCFAGADTATTAGPGVLVRGGDYIPGLGGGTSAGPLAVGGTDPATNSDPLVGFRCAR